VEVNEAMSGKPRARLVIPGIDVLLVLVRPKAIDEDKATSGGEERVLRFFILNS